jgi:hypothetical protein
VRIRPFRRPVQVPVAAPMEDDIDRLVAGETPPPPYVE